MYNLEKKIHSEEFEWKYLTQQAADEIKKKMMQHEDITLAENL